jgi:ABC-2 type transport system permease protein
MLVICRKELADHFSSTRFILLFTMIVMISLVMAYMVGAGLREELQGKAKPTLVFLLLFTSTGKFFSLIQFIAFFGPLIGIVLGFDAINKERGARTLSKLISQPIYRDAVINGKFLAGVFIITVMLLAIVLLISGIGLAVIGVVPGPEEIGRLAIYLIISIFYISFWLGISILFSILFRSIATSALAAVACWIFFSFFVYCCISMNFKNFS